MRVLLQRVSRASVTIGGRVHGEIGTGLLVLVGITPEDKQEDVDWLCGKIARLRIFGDEEGKMNLSVADVSGGLLVVSQFTLYASTKKGNRPSYLRSARPEVAVPLYERFVRTLREQTELQVATGEFGADMKVELLNDGPVTIWIDSKARE